MSIHQVNWTHMDRPYTDGEVIRTQQFHHRKLFYVFNNRQKFVVFKCWLINILFVSIFFFLGSAFIFLIIFKCLCTYTYIAERIELWIHYSPKGAATTPSSQTFDYLGFISLSDNASTKYKSRELQSVAVGPRNGTHLKLRMGAAQQNPLNPHQQVCVLRWHLKVMHFSLIESSRWLAKHYWFWAR